MQRFKDDTVIISDNYNLDYIKNIGKQSNTLSLYRVKAQGLINLDVDKGTQLYIRHAQKVNYPILVDNNRIVYRNFSQPQWKFVQDIVKGDYVGYPILKTSVNLFDINEEEAWYIGRYIADGYAHDSVRKSGKKEYRVCFSIGDAKIDTFLSKAKQYHIYKVKDKGCYRCDISSKRLLQLCEMCGRGALNKEIPKCFLDLPNELLKILIDGYLSGDGCRDIANNTNTCSTVSKKLAVSMQMAIHKVYQLPVKIHLYQRKHKKIVINNKEVNCNDIYMLVWQDKIGKKSNAIILDDYIWQPIKEIQQIKGRWCILQYA